MTQAEDKVLEEFIKEQYAKGYICPSKSPYMPPFFFIKKRDRKLRPVQDYQHINNYTIKNQYPTAYIQTNRKLQSCAPFHQARCLLGVQECPYQRRRA